MHSIASMTPEQITRALGEAAVRTWSSLPQEVQHHLFEEAAKSLGEASRPQLAAFLHDKHQRTTDAVAAKAREMMEPDSLGG